MNLRLTKDEYKLLMVLLNMGNAVIMDKQMNNEKIPKCYNQLAYSVLLGKLIATGETQGTIINWQEEYDIDEKEHEKIMQIFAKFNIPLE